jgi:amino acid adenylation domain-containing protein
MSDKLDIITQQISKLTPEKRQLLQQILDNKQTLSQPSSPIDYANQAHKTRKIPLSFSQERLWFFEHFSPNSCAYNINRVVKLIGNLNIKALEKSLQTIVNRHEILRTVFIEKNGIPYQKIIKNPPFKLNFINLSSINDQHKEAKLNQLIHQELRKSFNLTQDLMLRTSLYCLSPEEYIFCITIHHIASDGWSLGIFSKDLSELYNSFCQNQASNLPDLPLQYADFSLWQRNYFQGEKLEENLVYWRKKFQQNIPILNLPTDRPRPAIQSFKGSKYCLKIDAELTAKLKKLSRELKVTLFIVLLTAFNILLYRYSGEEKIIIGSAIAGRNYLALENLIGFFVNTLALKTDLSNNPSFVELLSRVKRTVQEAYINQELPYEKLIQELNPTRDLNRNALTQIGFSFQNTPENPLNLSGLKISSYGIEKGINKQNLSLASYLNTPDNGTSRQDLTLLLKEEDGEIGGVLEYNNDLFDEDTIKRFTSHFQVLLEGIINNPNQKISHLPLLTAREKQQILIDWNKTEANYPKDKCIHQLFEEQVAKTPDNIAVVFEEQQLTYRQLNEKANQLGHYLQKLGVKPETLVGICLERSLAMIIGVLGILKAGGAYVPLDPDYPQERLQFMIEDSQISILLSQEKLVTLLQFKRKNIIELDQDWQLIQREKKNNLEKAVKSDNLAYVIYTSGSTGKPKGVLIEHKGVVNIIYHRINKLLKVEDLETYAQTSSLTFDASVVQIFPSLFIGQKIVIVESLIALPNKEYFDCISALHSTPSGIETILENRDLPKNIKVVVIGGDKASDVLINKLNSYCSLPKILHTYGPTEITIYCTAILWQKNSNNFKKISIGKPIANTQVYILNQDLQLLPIGIVGEIYVSGVGLARGYLNRPELTAEKFMENPYGEGRLYKTGDLACYLPDGNIKFLGRVDHQVKIRGFRIELGEIEFNLNQHPQIKETVVIAKENEQGDKYLVAYLIAKETQPEIKELREFLGQKLPGYMIPSSFVFLNQFPLTPNGKIDRKALPEPDFEANREKEFIVPRNEIEIKLAEIWQEVLKIDTIGVHDNFFTLGGHSLLATQVVSRIRDIFQIDFPLKTLFEFPTIEQLSKYLTIVFSTQINAKKISAKLYKFT